ncbi:hypothetical protein CHS0354_015618 [Potamilus streckersoni]|uniref:Uncharacterized protein n=1 Tax=Potamilus streckersoni TaxID=2493646 RepID=A0AAE0TBP1_9BIVA|nr:hypothetical protein CHS0354_015618 [Potamilus streckersoni]
MASKVLSRSHGSPWYGTYVRKISISKEGGNNVTALYPYAQDSGSHAQQTFHQNGYTEDEEPQRDPDVFRETKEKEEIHFAEMGSVRQRFESGKSDSSISPKRRSVQEEYAEAEGGEYENEPVRDSFAVRESDTDTSAELPETGKTKSLLEKFKQIQSTDTTQSGRKPSPPKETGPVEYVSEPRAQIERYEGKSEEGIFESQPQTHEGIIKSGEKLQEDPLPEKGYAKNIANRYKEMDGKKTEVVTKEKKELTPDPTGKVEYVSEPRVKFDAYEGKPESGIFESKPHQEEDVVKSDAPVEDILPEKGAAKSILSKFKEIENEGKNKPPPSPSKRLTPDRSGKVEYVSEPRTVVEKYEPKVDAGVFENKPATSVEVVRSEDQVEDILPEKGYAKNVKERFLEIQRSSVSPTTPGKTKEFTPPRETSPGKTVSGVLENTPTESNLPKYSEVQELELPQKGMAKTVASKFKQMESISPSSQPRTKKEFTPPKEAGVYESTPVKSLVVEEQKPESGILESRPQEKRADIAREADTVESDLPEPGLTKNLTSKWKQLESESANNKGTKSVSPKCKEFTPPREDARVAEMRGLLSPKSPKGESGHVKPQDLPGQYQEQTQPVLYENEPVHNDNIAREDKTDWTDGMPAKDTTKILLNKFKSIQEQAKESEETPKPVSKKVGEHVLQNAVIHL